MAPPSSTPAKRQQSISSFFTQKSSATGSSQPLSHEMEGQVVKRTRSKTSNGAQLDEESDDDVVNLPRRVASATKRVLVEDEDLVNTGAERGSKRRKSSLSRTEDEDSLSFPDEETLAPTSSSGPSKSTTTKPSKVTARTERYLCKGSSQSEAPASVQGPTDGQTNVEEDTAARAKRELLHRKFVKKLGHPDSIAQIKRWKSHITEETAQQNEDDAEEGDEEEETERATQAAKSTKRKGAKTGKLTPMELQMLEIKKEHMDTLLVIEVGYRFSFFGEDARIAARELSIVCIPGKYRFDEHPSEAHLDRFASASIPVHRLPVHVKRLVSAGHKVGVVRQIETAALKKVGDNRNAPFTRKLTNLYTKGTYVDETEQLANGPSGGSPATGYLLCMTETKAKGSTTDEKVDVGILAVQPGTGDVIYDHFEDGFMRSEIETRLLHIAPCELLIMGELTRASEKLVTHLSGSTSNLFGGRVRVERSEKPKTMGTEAYSHVAQFYAGKMKAHANTDDGHAASLLEKVLKLPEPVTICLSAMITHLSEYGLEHVFDLTKYFQSFGARSHMMLSGNTLTSLEIYRNSTDHSEKGSLFWALDKTHTRFGQRLLRKWVGRPLIDRAQLEERISAVEELKEGSQMVMVEKIRLLLARTKSDLERSLLRIYYGKCSRPELLIVLQTMQKIANEFATVKESSTATFTSSLLNDAVAALPTMGPAVISFLDKVNAEAARSDDKYAFFREDEETEAITDHKLMIASVEQELDSHRAAAARVLKKDKVDYVSCAGIEYLIEVLNTELKNVPASWSKISGTKKLSRFHTPEVMRLVKERDQHKESLAAACDDAFINLLADISAHYQEFRDCVQALARLDCLLSLAEVASQPGYVKPEYSDDPEIHITEGRHPMIEHLLLDTYVPNDTDLSSAEAPVQDASSASSSSSSSGPSRRLATPRALLITGPNMGGKSSYVRQVALLAILAQLGSYVPAAAARVGLLHSVHTRMGALDNILAGESTFGVELSETAGILRGAGRRSLVVLDELGRGTSTNDGRAIAGAVLDALVADTRCMTLFVTHYQGLARDVERGVGSDGSVRNVHMAFEATKKTTTATTTTTTRRGGGASAAVERSSGAVAAADADGDGAPLDGDEEITFLYTLADGVSHRSYGLNVARLARIPDEVLRVAARMSREMEARETRKTKGWEAGRAVARLLDGARAGGAAAAGWAESDMERLAALVEEL